MEKQGSVDISRSSSENRRVDVPSSDAGDRSPNGSGAYGKLSEVCGFVGAIMAVLAPVILIIWAYVPDYWLNSIGIYFYPSRYGALPKPTYIMAAIILAIGCYIGLNFMATPPPTSLKSIVDECGNELLRDILSTYEDEQAVKPITHVGVTQFTDDVS
ncbi:N-acetylglucosaminyltransferase complex, subunit PIG-P [Handroanthus impetiginosus]|uniref:N-acetylglucosaminyltransferase complex, subunit PIG-P n=1 Tax=Handroanthus impetiginosus TaxID=429701 RepID=A0A2G9G4U7_9LAMI|nr:N-acetylglucosaminyltransferase complex, subunit PIG-P [Handroanthus impetiginosus]